MRVMFDFDDSTFKMHAEGVNNSDQAQKMERSWSEAILSFRDGDESMQIHIGPDGTMNFITEPEVAQASKAAKADYADGASPFSEASKVVVEPDGKPEAEVWSDTPSVKGAKIPDMGAAQPVPESGFIAMSHHADES